MPYGLYVSAAGAQSQAKRMEVISHNLANVDTVGFKRDLAVMRARYAEEIERGRETPGLGSLNDQGGGVEVAGTRTDYSPGPLKETGRATDLALETDGFFVVRRGDRNLLTRAGNFSMNAAGGLVTPDGDPVLNAEGQPVVADPELGPWQITADGSLSQAGSTQPLSIVQPASLGDLVKLGDNLFQPLGDVTPVPGPERRVAVGFVEASGVQPTTEMMDMIEASRAFEANVNLIRQHDQLLSGLLSRVLAQR